MNESGDFDLNPVANGFRLIADSTNPVGSQLGESVNIDPTGESVDIDPTTLRGIAEQAFPEPVIETFMSAAAGIMSGGMAVFTGVSGVDLPPPPLDMDDSPGVTAGGGEDESGVRRPLPLPSREGVRVAIPWVVISDLVYSLQGTPPELREALGIEGASNSDEVIGRLRENFSNVPDWMLSGGVAERFTRDPAFQSIGGSVLGASLEEAMLPRPADGQFSLSSSPQTFGAGQDGAVAAATCLVRGNWDGLGGHWWGWPFGWQVSLNYECAGTMAGVLMGAGGGGKLFNVIKSVATAQNVSAGIKALSLTAGTIIAIYAFVLGLNILSVRNNKGVRIQGNWPIIGGPGAFVWAIRG